MPRKPTAKAKALAAHRTASFLHQCFLMDALEAWTKHGEQALKDAQAKAVQRKPH